MREETTSGITEDTEEGTEATEAIYMTFIKIPQKLREIFIHAPIISVCSAPFLGDLCVAACR